ncbi:hypothetical protein AU476_33325 [Cupriavidus sp. UYMSc13B]|nr:hypothetical protein AU476_33325 [Cupriavidus sp. UYMSc13B]
MIYQPLTDDEWAVVEPLFGPQTPGPGGPRVASLRAERHPACAHHERRWVHLPQNLGYPSHITAGHNSRHWQQKGTMDVVLAALE